MNIALVLITLLLGVTTFIAGRNKHFVAEFINSFLPVSTATSWILAVVATIFVFQSSPPEFFEMLLLDLALLFLCLNLLPLLAFGALRPRGTRSREANLRVASFNKLITNDEVSKITSRVNQLKPDIIGFLEVKPQDYKEFVNNAKLKHQHLTKFSYGMGKSEFLLLSRYKLENINVRPIDHYGATLYAQTRIRNKKLTILVVHTAAPIVPVMLSERNEGIKNLAAFINKLETENIVIFGDFNLSPWSPTFRQFSQETKKKIYNTAKGRGLFFTWKAFWPFISHIDHMFVSTNLKTKKFVVDKSLGSDHKLIYTDLKI